MRGRIDPNPSFIAVVDLDARVRANHPLRLIKEVCDKALRELDNDFDRVYKDGGRPSIPPEQLLKGSLLQIMYGIRSERQLCERIDDSLTFRWFLDLPLDQEAWVPTVYTHNRDRLLTTEMSRSFLSRVVEQARDRGLVSSDHFSVDGTLLQAWASNKSLQPMDPGSDEDSPPPSDPPGSSSSEGTKEAKGKDILRNFRGQQFSNATHRSSSDPDSRLARKGDNLGAKPSYLGNAVMENRSGLVVEGEVRLASGDGGEVAAALAMIDRMEGDHAITVGADKGYDCQDFVDCCRQMNTSAHAAQNRTARRRSFVPDEVAETDGYKVSIRRRKRIEQVFGWVKLSAGMRQLKVRGKEAVSGLFLLALSAFNLVRMGRLMAEPA